LAAFRIRANEPEMKNRFPTGGNNTKRVMVGENLAGKRSTLHIPIRLGARSRERKKRSHKERSHAEGGGRAKRGR